jgi:hypothetical protein
MKLFNTFSTLFNTKSEQEIILEIHNAFDSAQDRLLDEANSLLNSIDVTKESDIEKLSVRLVKVGFLNTPTAKAGLFLKEEKENNKKLLVETESQARLIQYYKLTYPFLKFLTVDELNKICEKYNLIHAPIANYINEVPEKNLRDIEHAQKLKECDSEPCEYLCRVEGVWPHDLPSNLEKILTKGFKAPMEITPGDRSFLRAAKVYGGYNGSYEGWVSSVNGKCILEKIDKSGLFIAAPNSHFNLEGLDKKSKNGFFNVFKTEVKDPIVFRYCRGGIQVLTKWGLEASDEALINPINN